MPIRWLNSASAVFRCAAVLRNRRVLRGNVAAKRRRKRKTEPRVRENFLRLLRLFAAIRSGRVLVAAPLPGGRCRSARLRVGLFMICLAA